MSPAHARSGWGRRIAPLLACAALLAGKLWLVAPDEIAALPNPHDQLHYATMARHLLAGRWLGPYDEMTLAREPGYPLFVAAVHATGARLRPATELLVAAAGGLFAWAAVRTGLSAGLGVLVFAAVVLQPHGLAVHRQLLPAPFAAAALLAALAGLLGSARARPPGALGWGLLAGAGLGALWIARPEKPWVAALPAVFVLLEWAGERRRRGSLRALGRAAALAALPLAGLLVAELSVSAWNRSHYGLFATSEFTAEGYPAANRALVRIPHESPRRFVPVPRDVREKAYAVSPAFRELRPHLEGPNWARSVSCRWVEVCDDLAGGWFYWMLRDAAARAGHFGSAQESDAFFARVAREIDAACARGALFCRGIWPPFVHPHPEAWAGAVPDALAALLGRIAGTGRPRDRHPGGDVRGATPEVRGIFDTVARRRSELASNGLVAVTGRVEAEEGTLAWIALRGAAPEGGRALAEERLPPGAQAAAAFRFEFEKPLRRLADLSPVLDVRLASGRRVRLPLPAAGGSAEREGVRATVETLRETGAVDPVRAAVRTALWVGHSRGVLLATAGGLGAALLLPLPRVRRGIRGPVARMLLLVAAAVGGRLVLLALMDASSAPTRSSRYLYPVISLYGVVWVALLAEVVRALRRGPSASPRPESAQRPVPGR